MAGHMMNRWIALVCGALSLPAVAVAQGLSDPMQPPVEFMPGGARGSAMALPNAQVVVLGSGRRQITLNGQTLLEGERLGDSRLETLSDSEIVLRVDGSRTRERIPLYPGVAKTPSTAATGKSGQDPGTGKTEGKK